jgi:hypothetical protein
VVGEAASAQLDAFEVLLGDWVGHAQGGTIKLSNVRWDDSGAFVLADVSFFAPEIDPSRTSLRVGWDPVRKSIVSWAFDSKGGLNEGVWTKIGKQWIIKWNGYTADAELTSSTHVITPIDDLSFRWAIVNKVVGDELIPDSAIVFARPPAAPSVSAK